MSSDRHPPRKRSHHRAKKSAQQQPIAFDQFLTRVKYIREMILGLLGGVRRSLVIQRLRLVALAFLLAVPSIAGSEAGCRPVDGDTLRCGREQVRIAGVDTPEKGEPGYSEAKERLRQLTEGKTLRIERRARDRYGRTVGKVFADGVDVGKQLRLEGYGKPRARRGGNTRK